MKKLVALGMTVLAPILLVACGGQNSAPKKVETVKPFIKISNTDVDVDSDGEYEFSFKTNPGATYTLYDNDNQERIIQKKTKSGSVTMNGNGEGSVTLTVSFNGKTASKSINLVGEDSSNSSDNSESSTRTYGLNEEATIGTDSAELYGLSFTSVTKQFNEHGKTLVDSDIPSIAISNDKSVQFTVNYTNKGDDTPWLPSIYDFTVYGENGTAGEVVSQQDGQNEVSVGHSGVTTFWVNFSQAMPAGAKLTAEYRPDGMETAIEFSLTVN